MQTQELSRLPIALSRRELRNVRTFERRAGNYDDKLDTGTAEVLRELIWRQVESDRAFKQAGELFRLVLQARRVDIAEQPVWGDEKLTPAEEAEALREVFGEFPAIRPFSETPAGTVIGKRPGIFCPEI